MSAKPIGGQYEFYQKLLMDDGKLVVTVDGIDDLIFLLSNINIQLGDLNNINNNITDIGNDVENIKQQLSDLVHSFATVKKKVVCVENTNPCNYTTLMQGNNGPVYVKPNGTVVNNISKGSVYTWGGWNIVR